MIFDALYYRERARRAVDELRDVRAAYTGMTDNYQRLLLCLDAANEREADLRRLLEEAEQHLECMTLDNADLERVNAALVAGLRWFEGTEEAK